MVRLSSSQMVADCGRAVSPSSAGVGMRPEHYVGISSMVPFSKAHEFKVVAPLLLTRPISD